MKRLTTNLPGDYIFIVYTIRNMYIDISFYKYYERYVYVELGSLLCSMDAAIDPGGRPKKKKRKLFTKRFAHRKTRNNNNKLTASLLGIYLFKNKKINRRSYIYMRNMNN